MDSKFSLSDFDGIDIDGCLRAESYYLSKVNSDGGLKKRLELAYNNLVRTTYSFESIKESNRCDFLCFRGIERDDYSFFFNQVVEQIKEHSVIKVEDYRKPSDRLNLDVTAFINNNRHLIALIQEGNSIRKACLYLHLCSYLIVLSAIRKIEFKVLVVFADMQPVDYLLVSYFKKLGTKTVTLQHGLYVEYENYDTVNKVNYEQQCADYFLAWGECTGALIKKYHPETRVVICGKPVLSMAEMPLESEINDRPFILVVLDQAVFDKHNYEMLRVSHDYARLNNLLIKVKFHPQNDKYKYHEEFSFISESGDLKNAEFIIGHTSSLLFESLVLGLKVFKFKTEAPCLYMEENYQFSDLPRLQSIVCNEPMSIGQRQHYIAKTGIESESRYSQFFDSL
jgi:hypothetical protein